jgi:hypothetical protein
MIMLVTRSVACAMCAAMLLCSCAILKTDEGITATVAAATSAGLKYSINDPERRHVVANYVYVYAGALRTVTGNPTPDQLIDLLNSFIPASIRAKYPELGFAVSIVVTEYQSLYAKYRDNVATLYRYLNDVAAGLELGASGL